MSLARGYVYPITAFLHMCVWLRLVIPLGTMHVHIHVSIPTLVLFWCVKQAPACICTYTTPKQCHRICLQNTRGCTRSIVGCDEHAVHAELLASNEQWSPRSCFLQLVSNGAGYPTHIVTQRHMYTCCSIICYYFKEWLGIDTVLMSWTTLA